MDTNFVEAVCNYILENLREDISIDKIADHFHYNKYYVMRKFKAVTGLTINDYINKNKIYNSVNQIISTDDTILKIALDNGFNSLEYYSEKFKEIIGVGPLKFRKLFSIGYLLSRKENDMTKLEQIKAELKELQEYQEYLRSLSMSQSLETKENPPKVYKINPKKVRNAA